MFNNFKITTRLTGTLAMLTALIFSLCALALWQMGTMRASTQAITVNWLPSVELVNAMNTDMSKFRIGEFKHALNTDDAEMAVIEQEIAAVKAGFEKNREAYAKLISSDEERRLYENFMADWKKYLDSHERMIDTS